MATINRLHASNSLRRYYGHRIGYSLVDRRIQNLLIIVFKTINNYPAEYLRDLVRLRDNIKNLRGVHKLQVPKPNTTRLARTQ